MTDIKKILGAFLLGTLLFLTGGLGNLTAQATSNLNSSLNLEGNQDLSYEKYSQLVEEGILEDVSFDLWIELNSEPTPDRISDPSLMIPTPRAAITYKAGDIFITKNTSSSGIAGHTGIVINSTTILHTSGWKSEPYPIRISIKDWYSRYPETKIIRPNDANIGANAAQKAISIFDGKKIKYLITPNVKDISNTYCSELVWYAYHKAGLDYKVYQSTGIGITLGIPTIIKPYDFSTEAYVNANGFKFLDNAW